MSSDKVFTAKLGTTRAGERTRIWLEGKRLIAHHFNKGECVQRVWNEGKLVLRVVSERVFNELPRDERTTVAGTDARPIIDIATERVAVTFTGSHVSVTYRAGLITITNSNHH